MRSLVRQHVLEGAPEFPAYQGPGQGPFLRRANPTVFRLTRHTKVPSPGTETAASIEDLPST